MVNLLNSLVGVGWESGWLVRLVVKEMESWQREQFVQARRGADCLGRGNTEREGVLLGVVGGGGGVTM